MQRIGPTKKRKRICSDCIDCFGHRTDFMCWTESGLFTRDGWIRTDSQRSQFHPTNLFLSLSLWCKDLVHQKEKKEKQWVCWLFWPLYCLYALNREWTLYKRWVNKNWPTKGSVSPNKSLPWSHLWCKDLVPQKKRKRICSECVYCFGHGTVFMHQTESGLCTRGGWLRADPQRS